MWKNLLLNSSLWRNTMSEMYERIWKLAQRRTLSLSQICIFYLLWLGLLHMTNQHKTNPLLTLYIETITKVMTAALVANTAPWMWTRAFCLCMAHSVPLHNPFFFWIILVFQLLTAQSSFGQLRLCFINDRLWRIWACKVLSADLFTFEWVLSFTLVHWSFEM